jgi:hypothetical protein
MLPTTTTKGRAGGARSRGMVVVWNKSTPIRSIPFECASPPLSHPTTHRPAHSSQQYPASIPDIPNIPLFLLPQSHIIFITKKPRIQGDVVLCNPTHLGKCCIYSPEQGAASSCRSGSGLKTSPRSPATLPPAVPPHSHPPRKAWNRRGVDPFRGRASLAPPADFF